MGEEILIGRIAVQRGLLSQEQMDLAVAVQAKSSPRRALGEILVEQGMITRAQLDSLIAGQQVAFERADAILPRKKGESLFGKIALRLGLCTEEQLFEALRVQATAEEAGNFRQVGDILVEKGWLSPAQIRQVLEAQERSLLWCPQCGGVFNVAHVVKRTARCPECGVVLEEAKEGQVSAEAQIAFTPEGMRVASLHPGAAGAGGEEPATRPVGTIVAKRFRCGACGNQVAALVHRGAKTAACPICRAEAPLPA